MSRQTKRAQERAIKKAKAAHETSKRPGAPPVPELAKPPEAPTPSADEILGQVGGQGDQVEMQGIYTRIGALTVERDHWYQKSQELQAAIEQMGSLPPTGPLPVNAQAGQAMQDVVAAQQTAVEEATEKAMQAVEAGVDAETQATRDAEAFPELQNTDGDVVQEEGTPVTREALESAGMGGAEDELLELKATNEEQIQELRESLEEEKELAQSFDPEDSGNA